MRAALRSLGRVRLNGSPVFQYTNLCAGDVVVYALFSDFPLQFLSHPPANRNTKITNIHSNGFDNRVAFVVVAAVLQLGNLKLTHEWCRFVVRFGGSVDVFFLNVLFVMSIVSNLPLFGFVLRQRMYLWLNCYYY